jgi:hypothetical protein
MSRTRRVFKAPELLEDGRPKDQTESTAKENELYEQACSSAARRAEKPP